MQKCNTCKFKPQRLKCLECEQLNDAQYQARDDYLHPQIIVPSKDPILDYIDGLTRRQKIKVAVYIITKITRLPYADVAKIIGKSEDTIKRCVRWGKGIDR
jgi:hypothetical protein